MLVHLGLYKHTCVMQEGRNGKVKMGQDGVLPNSCNLS